MSNDNPSIAVTAGEFTPEIEAKIAEFAAQNGLTVEEVKEQIVIVSQERMDQLLRAQHIERLQRSLAYQPVRFIDVYENARPVEPKRTAAERRQSLAERKRLLAKLKTNKRS